MNDAFVGDIGDFGKYGLLRELTNLGLTLSVNWYKTDFETTGGGFIDYLNKPDEYREYDPELFQALYKIVFEDKDRRIERVEDAGIIKANFFNESIESNREKWWKRALEVTSGTDVVFLDPDNGLETPSMNARNSNSPMHVRWSELQEYYSLGKTVIMYQQRPKIEKEALCKERALRVNELLEADVIHILDFPRRTNRYYFIFTQKKHEVIIEKLCNLMHTKWRGICKYDNQRFERD